MVIRRPSSHNSVRLVNAESLVIRREVPQKNRRRLAPHIRHPSLQTCSLARCYDRCSSLSHLFYTDLHPTCTFRCRRSVKLHRYFASYLFSFFFKYLFMLQIFYTLSFSPFCMACNKLVFVTPEGSSECHIAYVRFKLNFITSNISL